MKSKREWIGSSSFSWCDIDSLVDILERKVRNTGFKFDKIATISRGGLVPARLMADKFDIKKILVDKDRIPPETLFVDDIYDSGDTYKKIIPHVISKRDFLYATLVARIGMKYPRYLVFAEKTKGREYVVFPWEKLEFKRSKAL